MTERRIKIILDQTEARAKAVALDNSLKAAGRSADNLNRGLSKTKTEGDKAAAGLTSTEKAGRALATTLTRVAVSVSVAFASQKIIEYADAFTNVQNQLRQTVTSQEELNVKFEEISNIAIRSRASLEGTAKLYTRFRLSTDEATFSNERLLRVTETVNKGLALSGATATESAGALLQLSQAVASGVLRGQEFNSVSEQAPIILKAVAAETKKTIGELRAFAATGGITADLLIKSLENYGATVDRVFAKSNRTFSQSIEVARTETIKFIGASELIGSAVTAVGDSIVFLSRNLETLQNIIIGLTVIFGARFVGAIFAGTSALVGNARQALVAKVTYDALGVAITRTTATMGAATLAARGLTSAMAILGGPAGVIFLAASALIYFGTQSNSAKVESENLKTEIDELISKYLELNEVGRKIQLQKLQTEASTIREQRQLIQEQIDAQQNLVSSRSATGGGLGGIRESTDLANLQAQAAEYDKQLDAIAKKQAGLFQSTLPTITTSPDAEAKSFDTREEELAKALEIQQQIADAERRLTAAEIKERDKRIKAAESNEVKLAELFEKQQERGRRVVDGLISENALIEESLNQRSTVYEQYGNIIYDNFADPFLKQRALLEVNLIEQENALRLSLKNQLQIIAEKGQRQIEDENLTGAALSEAQRLLADQAILEKALFEQQLTELQRKAAAERERIAIQENINRINTFQNYANAALALNEAFGSKSEKANKRRKRVSVIVDTAAGVTKAISEYNFGMAALIAANGILQLSTINSANGGGGSISTPSAGGASMPTPNLPQAPEQVQSFEDLGRLELLEQLKELAAGDIQIPARYMLQYLAAEQGARRIGPG